MTDVRSSADADDVDVDVDVFERAEAEGPAAGDRGWVPLPSSDMLTVEDADELLRWRDASVVAVVGERKGGKTTLVTELYDRFLRGPFADALFTHSLSLLGFEKKSFQSRAESGGDLPDTPRTSSQDGLTFFHLGVTDAGGSRRTDLLISERAGEAYREVRDRPAGAFTLVEVRKARVIALVIDGERVADDRRRAEALASARDILRALAADGVASTMAEVQLVTTKCDLLDGPGAAPALAALGEFEERTISAYPGRFAAVTAFRTAARDPSGVAEPARGLAPLLRSWLRPAAVTPASPARVPELVGEFDRLLVRRVA